MKNGPKPYNSPKDKEKNFKFMKKKLTFGLRWILIRSAMKRNQREMGWWNSYHGCHHLANGECGKQFSNVHGPADNSYFEDL